MTDDFKELCKARDGSMSNGDLSLALIRLNHANTDSGTHVGNFAEGKWLRLPALLSNKLFKSSLNE